MIYEQGHIKVKAILDWELSTLGDPLTDLATMLISFHMPSGHPHIGCESTSYPFNISQSLPNSVRPT